MPADGGGCLTTWGVSGRETGEAMEEAVEGNMDQEAGVTLPAARPPRFPLNLRDRATRQRG